uniref:Alternative oxidase n=1 Tax=Panagrolaimus davidi TaxID=227884 RepID=A0A914P892_9BILA
MLSRCGTNIRSIPFNLIGSSVGNTLCSRYANATIPSYRLFITAAHADKPSKKEVKESPTNAADATYPTKEQLAQLVERHQVLGVSMPVRSEFIRDSPLKSDDLEAIDIKVYHRKPVTISDHIAFRTVKFLRFFADAFFRKRYVHRAIVLETVAGVPGMVAGMFCHMRSLRRMQNDSGWIEKLLHEAENERMHLMIWMNVTNPTYFERILVTLVQGVFFNIYSFFYLFFPRTAHRMVGYLEEEAIVSYNSFAEQIRNGNIKNDAAPQIAISYYNLDKNARLLDVVYAVRADEAAHRDTNHHFADRIDAHNENLSEKFK